MRRLYTALLACSLLPLSLLAGCSQEGTSTSESTAAANPAASKTNVVDGDQLKKRLDDAIAFTKTRVLNANQNNTWQIMHGILAYGHDLKMQANGQVVPALEWMMAGGQVAGWTLRPGDHGLDAVLEAGTKSGQGHEDQWLGYMSQTGLDPDQPIIVGGKTFKFADLISQAQWDIYPGMEATWTLMGLSSYLPLDTKWTAKDGQEWTIERIVAQESAENLNESACGGTHRMYGLAMAMNRYLSEGKKPEGGWLAAEQKIKQAIEDAHRYQQPDGLFSTSYFARSGSSPDIALQMSTTGHVFEFLAMGMTDEEIKQPWMTEAANALCGLFEETREMPVECASLYHAAHGLILYRLRRFGPPEAVVSEPAGSQQTPATQAVAPTNEPSTLAR